MPQPAMMLGDGGPRTANALHLGTTRPRPCSLAVMDTWSYHRLTYANSCINCQSATPTTARHQIWAGPGCWPMDGMAGVREQPSPCVSLARSSSKPEHTTCHVNHTLLEAPSSRSWPIDGLQLQSHGVRVLRHRTDSFLRPTTCTGIFNRPFSALFHCSDRRTTQCWSGAPTNCRPWVHAFIDGELGPSRSSRT